MIIDNKKAIELPIGDNAAIIRHKAGMIHVGTPVSDVVREIWRSIPKSSRDEIPKPLRRGVIKFIIDTHKANLALYIDVMRGTV